jgi:hypothetical protein
MSACVHVIVVVVASRCRGDGVLLIEAATRVDRVAGARAPAADRWRPSPRAIDARVFRRLAEDRGVSVAPRFHICELTLDSGLHHLGRLAARRRWRD